MFGRVINFKIKPGTAEEVAKRAEQTTAPWMRGKKGFHGLHLLKVSDTEMICFEMWESKAAADASAKEVERHTQQTLGDLLTAPLSFTEGEQIVHAAGREPHHRPGMHSLK